MNESLLTLHSYPYYFATPSLSDNPILPHPPTLYYLKKSKKKDLARIATPNRPLLLLLFIFTFNLDSVQEHHQQCPILKNLDVIQRFQYEVRIHLFQKLRSIRIPYELLRPIPFQQILTLHLLLPALHKRLPILDQSIPRHQIRLYQRFFIYMAVETAHNPFYLVPFTALPYLTVNACTTSPTFPCKHFIAFSADNLRSKRVVFRPVGIGVYNSKFLLHNQNQLVSGR